MQATQQERGATPAASPGPQGAAGGQPGPSAADRMKAMAADPRLRDAVQRVGTAVMKIVYDRGVSEQLVQMIGAAETPEDGVARAVQMVMRRVAESTKGDKRLALLGLAPAVYMVAELAAAAGLMEFDAGKLPELLKTVVQKIGGSSPAGEEAPPAEAPPAAPPGPSQGLVAQAMGG